MSNIALGKGYPFYLNNRNLKESYYYYVLCSPKLSEDLVPMLSLIKTDEKTVSEPWGHGSDILSVCLGSKKDISVNGCNLVSDILANITNKNYKVYKNGREFPLIEMTGDEQRVMKALIIGLRDALRWKTYKFQPGRQVDILWTEDEFVVFDICGNDDEIWLKPSNVYKISDVSMKNPLPELLSLSSIEDFYPREKFKRIPQKISELNRAIKAVEWTSFNRVLHLTEN